MADRWRPRNSAMTSTETPSSRQDNILAFSTGESILTPLLGFWRTISQNIAKPNFNDSCRCCQTRLSEPTTVNFLPRGITAVWTVCITVKQVKTTFFGVIKNRGKTAFNLRDVALFISYTVAYQQQTKVNRSLYCNTKAKKLLTKSRYFALIHTYLTYCTIVTSYTTSQKVKIQETL
jgi:hypothetical protein